MASSAENCALAMVSILSKSWSNRSFIHTYRYGFPLVMSKSSSARMACSWSLRTRAIPEDIRLRLNASRLFSRLFSCKSCGETALSCAVFCDVAVVSVATIGEAASGMSELCCVLNVSIPANAMAKARLTTNTIFGRRSALRSLERSVSASGHRESISTRQEFSTGRQLLGGSMSKNTFASEYMSLRRSQSEPDACSGDVYPAVPPGALKAAKESLSAKSKSIRTGSHESRDTMMFDGFISLWTIPML